MVKKILKWGFISLLWLIGCIGAITTDYSEPEEVTTKQLTRADSIKVCFSAWDGSHRKLEQLVKAALNDPDSYEHETTTYRDTGSTLIVRMVYRARNAFGGYVRGSVLAECAIDGTVIRVIESN